MFKSDQTLDFHNKQVADVALGQKCVNSKKSCAYIMTSPLGHIYTNACPNGLHCVKLYGDTSYDNINWNTEVELIRASTLLPRNTHVNQLKKWMKKYFSQPLQCEGIELSFCGLEDYGEFNSKIWMTIRDTCPAGELMSYSELAQRAGMTAGASKVVGYAINKNPYMLVVGDHRVVKASGEIWCENDSQRNKLRRLLVNYEISFTSETLEEALLRVKRRNDSTKDTRRRNTSTKVKKELEDDEEKPKRKKSNARNKTNSKKATKRRKVESSESEGESDLDSNDLPDDD